MAAARWLYWRLRKCWALWDKGAFCPFLMEIPPFLVFLVFRMSFIVTHYKCGMSDKQLGESCPESPRHEIAHQDGKKSHYLSLPKHTFLHSSCKKVRAFFFFFPPSRNPSVAWLCQVMSRGAWSACWTGKRRLNPLPQHLSDQTSIAISRSRCVEKATP